MSADNIEFDVHIFDYLNKRNVFLQFQRYKEVEIT